jgi:hypothetical protein
MTAVLGIDTAWTARHVVRIVVGTTPSSTTQPQGRISWEGQPGRLSTDAEVRTRKIRSRLDPCCEGRLDQFDCFLQKQHRRRRPGNLGPWQLHHDQDLQHFSQGGLTFRVAQAVAGRSGRPSDCGAAHLTPETAHARVAGMLPTEVHSDGRVRTGQRAYERRHPTRWLSRTAQPFRPCQPTTIRFTELQGQALVQTAYCET